MLAGDLARERIYPADMSDLVIRSGIPEDVGDLTRIYNSAILNTTATFDIVPKTVEERIGWFESHSDDYPLLVADLDGRAVGWAEIRPYGTRAAYRHTVENAVYVDERYQGRGIGAALLEALLEAAKKRNHHAVIALIVGGNEASERLHIRHGFELVGCMREVGRKFDRWLDVLVYEKILDTGVRE